MMNYSVNTVAGIQTIKLMLSTHVMRFDKVAVEKDEGQCNINSNAHKSTLGRDATESLAE